MVDFGPEEDEKGVGREVDLPGKEEGHVVEKRSRRGIRNVHEPLVREDEEQGAASEEAHHVEEVKDLLRRPPVLWQAQLNANELDLFVRSEGECAKGGSGKKARQSSISLDDSRARGRVAGRGGRTTGLRTLPLPKQSLPDPSRARPGCTPIARSPRLRPRARRKRRAPSATLGFPSFSP